MRLVEIDGKLLGYEIRLKPCVPWVKLCRLHNAGSHVFFDLIKLGIVLARC